MLKKGGHKGETSCTCLELDDYQTIKGNVRMSLEICTKKMIEEE